MLSINTNHAANLAAQSLYKTKNDLEGSLNKLSSGSRIVKSSDDAGWYMATRNAGRNQP
jgi:flagellin-like hook-associated protein FlgL